MTMKIAEAAPREAVSIDAEKRKARELCYAVDDKLSSGGSSEMENDSDNSSDETESPRAVWRWRRHKKDELVHSQILKIREEDSHLGDDVVGADKEKLVKAAKTPFPSSLDAVFYSRPILPCSPLGGKTSSLEAHH